MKTTGLTCTENIIITKCNKTASFASIYNSYDSQTQQYRWWSKTEYHYHLFSFCRSVQDYKIHGYGNGHIFRTEGVRPTQNIQQSHGSVQFFEVAVQCKLFSVIKYNKIE